MASESPRWELRISGVYSTRDFANHCILCSRIGTHQYKLNPKASGDHPLAPTKLLMGQERMERPLPKWVKEMRDRAIRNGARVKIHDYGKSLISVYRENGDLDDTWEITPAESGEIPNAIYGDGKNGEGYLIDVPTRIFSITITQSVNGWDTHAIYIYSENKLLASKTH